MTEPHMSFPAPKYLKYDPWFGPAVLSEEQQKYMLAELERDNILIPLREEKADVDNIHKVMYNLATQWKKRLGGGSESYWI
jgi:hypothetical protein